MLPELLVELRVAVPAEDVVDQHVEAVLLLLDPGEEVGHLAAVEMVNRRAGGCVP
jgi:hypothetical protein